MLPVVDIVEVGTGGGSIAWIDEVGALKVGPRSAGGYPGRCATAQGGTEPTVTDANVVLGRSARAVSSAARCRSTSRARAKRSAHRSPRRSDSLEAAALGIIKIAVAEDVAGGARGLGRTRLRSARLRRWSASAARARCTRSQIARELHIPTLIIPRAARRISRPSACCSPICATITSAPIYKSLAETDFDDVRRDLRRHDRRGARTAARRGRGAETRSTFQRFLDIRYVGQEFPIQMPIPRVGHRERRPPPSAAAFDEFTTGASAITPRTKRSRSSMSASPPRQARSARVPAAPARARRADRAPARVICLTIPTADRLRRSTSARSSAAARG